VLTTPDATVVSLETTLGMNAGNIPQPSPSEPQVLAAVSSDTSPADMNTNSGKRDKAIPFPSQMASTETIGNRETIFLLFQFIFFCARPLTCYWQ